ncbi:hypothetical protein [Streptomyces sp. NPDC005828]|uniref:hypothetical protein n=1 Tax=Streptomyces sp. NPDC005828 TaxID=3157071 RepID=UPI0034013D32
MSSRKAAAPRQMLPWPSVMSRPRYQFKVEKLPIPLSSLGKDYGCIRELPLTVAPVTAG